MPLENGLGSYITLDVMGSYEIIGMILYEPYTIIENQKEYIFSPGIWFGTIFNLVHYDYVQIATSSGIIHKIDKKFLPEFAGRPGTGVQSELFNAAEEASGDYSHAEGLGTKATGYAAHAEGYKAKAYGDFSHAEGHCTIAEGDYIHAQGTYNINLHEPYLHIVGNGTSEDNRSNAHTLDSYGDAWYAGNVYVGSTSGTNRDEGSKKLATEEYVNSNAIVAPITASVGQVLVVKTVDANGHPIEWETIDLDAKITEIVQTIILGGAW